MNKTEAAQLIGQLVEDVSVLKEWRSQAEGKLASLGDSEKGSEEKPTTSNSTTKTSPSQSEDTPGENNAQVEDPRVGVLEDRISGLEERNAELEERARILEGEPHKTEIIIAYLQDIPADEYFKMGVNLGYLESNPLDSGELADEENAEDPEVSELALEDSGNTVRISKTEPEDLANWEHSEVLGAWFQIVPTAAS